MQNTFVSLFLYFTYFYIFLTTVKNNHGSTDKVYFFSSKKGPRDYWNHCQKAYWNFYTEYVTPDSNNYMWLDGSVFFSLICPSKIITGSQLIINSCITIFPYFHLAPYKLPLMVSPFTTWSVTNIQAKLTSAIPNYPLFTL